MLLKYFYDQSLAHASYLVGCQRTGEAVVIDPARDITPYLKVASEEGLHIAGAAETHIHADYVSGARELADRVHAKLYLSDTGPKDWKYLFADQYDSQLLSDGDEFFVGKVKLKVLSTPGHTPESISFLLTDEGSGATSPMGIFTGDFVFVGSIGRPDLLETAAGVLGSAEEGAQELYRSIERFRSLPDHVQVWPAHGAGSACGKGLGAIPSSTVGYEKLFNPALQFHSQQEFVDYILADQPETPSYFAIMKRVNKVGPTLLRELPAVQVLQPEKLPATAREQFVIDTRDAKEFARAHVPATINVPANALVQWAGFFVEEHQPIYLISDASRIDQELRNLRSIGIDHVQGYFDAQHPDTLANMKESYVSTKPEELQSDIEDKRVRLLDVRAATEFQEGHIPNAEHRFLGHLLRSVKQIERAKPVVVNCLGGGRSAIAASILQREGFDVINLEGGYRAWRAAKLPSHLDVVAKSR